MTPASHSHGHAERAADRAPDPGTGGQGRLGPRSRVAAVEAMASRHLDVLVLGDDLVAAGIALDAVTRGLAVGLVASGDWGQQASGRPAVSLGGGLGVANRGRRSSDGAFGPGQVRMALRERDLLIDVIAPHLVRRVPVLRPLRGGVLERVAAGATLAAAEWLARTPGESAVLPAHRHLTRRAVRRLVPALDPSGLTGAVQYWDGVVDEARLAVTLVRTAAAYGAQVAQHLHLDSLIEQDGRVVGAAVADRPGGRLRHLQASVTVDARGGAPEGGATARSDTASGPGVDARGVGTAVPASVTGEIPGSRARLVRLVVPRDRIRSSSGLRISVPGGASCTVLPWGRHWLVSVVVQVPTPTEDADIDSAVHPADQDEALLVRALRCLDFALTTALSMADVQSYEISVVRATVPGCDALLGERPGLVGLDGAAVPVGAYRRVAEQAVDAAAAHLGGLVARCVTTRLPLLGADGFAARWNQRHLLARRAGVHVARAEHLLQRYGSLAEDLLDQLAGDAALAEPVPGAEDVLAGEIAYAVSHEGAGTLADVMTRRTRIALESGDGGRTCAPYVADLLAGRLLWDAPTTSREIAQLLRAVGSAR